jgi:hypothetical protein
MTNHWIINEQIMNLVDYSHLMKKILIKSSSQKGQIFKGVLKAIKKTSNNEF